MDTKHIKISDYNYSLPDERIAKFPIVQRDHSKLLVYKHGVVSDDVFYHLPDYLPKGALMIFNNTKVIQARMHFRKETGALIEVFLMEPAAPTDYELMFQTAGHCSWLCMVGNLKILHLYGFVAQSLPEGIERKCLVFYLSGISIESGTEFFDAFSCCWSFDVEFGTSL